MDKLTAIKIKYDDGTYSDEIPVNVLSENVEWDNTHTLVDVLGSIDVDVTGTIQDQINQLFNEKVNSSEIVVLKSRIDNLIKLESGSTTGDAELADIRVGADGRTYETAGDAVREQLGVLLDTVKRSVKDNVLLELRKVQITGTGKYKNQIYEIPAQPGERYTLSIENVYNAKDAVVAIIRCVGMAGETQNDVRLTATELSKAIQAGETTDKIRVLLCASNGTELAGETAVFESVKLVKGVEGVKKRLSEDIKVEYLEYKGIDPVELNVFHRSAMRISGKEYRVQAICRGDDAYYIVGGATAKDGTCAVARTTDLQNLSDMMIREVPGGGHANDCSYKDGYLYICTANDGTGGKEGTSELNAVLKVSVKNNYESEVITLPIEGVTGIEYKRPFFYLGTPNAIWRTRDMMELEKLTEGELKGELINRLGIPNEELMSQGIFAEGDSIFTCTSRKIAGTHVTAILQGFNIDTGKEIALAGFDTFGFEFEGGMAEKGKFYFVTDGTTAAIMMYDNVVKNAQYKLLNNGDDLNKALCRGDYYCTDGTKATSLSNAPSGLNVSFTMTVRLVGLLNREQRIRTLFGREWWRVYRYSQGTWTDWTEIL